MVYFGQEFADILPLVSLSPAVIMPEGFVFMHRKDADADIFFVANQEAAERAADISFNISGKRPEMWDPLTGERRELVEYSVGNGRTVVPLQFASAGSCFVIFRKPLPAARAQGKNFPEYVSAKTLSGKWEVDFDGSAGPSFSATFERLGDWSASADERIKYFCGRASYRLRFDFDGDPDASWFLNLGKVDSLAKIRLNGRPMATLWCYPYRADVSKFLKRGGNELEVEMVNQWWNRLIGDEQPGVVPYTTVSARQFWKAGDPLVPSGLSGPVTLERILP